MVERPQSIRCGEDIPLRFKEQLETYEILSSEENVLLFYKKSPILKKISLKDQFFGVVLTNLRVFQYNNSKVEKYVFLNDIRLIKDEKRGIKKFLKFQLVDGTFRSFGISEKKVINFFGILFDAILRYRFREVCQLLLSDKERFHNELMAIFSLNMDIDKNWLKLGEKLWQCRAEVDESLTEMILRILRPTSKLSKVRKLWDNHLDINEARNRLIYWSKQLGLKLPSGD